ncbi:MAG: C40 family peptidase [Deltaproteobacteria bacterium]|nr:C40 family peptidase [Deltaproteobacteria bacterium]MBW2448177.1 C40 family peptidase [Deltaproteobacteria bacterium]
MRPLVRGLALAPLAWALACAATPTPVAPSGAASRSHSVRNEAVRTATSMIGVPYRWGGRTPRGFDCSGLVVYSYGEAGLRGLPHSAAALERHARPIALASLEPGDLLFFDLEGRKAAHVAIYLGGRAFVHAPSLGKRVERVDFDHVYWGTRIRRAGRIAR